MRAKVMANGVRLYASNSPISAAAGFAAIGTELEIEAEYGGWCKLTDGRWIEAIYTEAIDVSGGGVTSWNDLEDKPFGETEEEIELVPETVVTLAQEEMGTFATLGALCDLEEGKEYVVYWQGTPYRVTCVAHDNPEVTSLGLGNLSILGAGEDTGEPFLYAYMPDFGMTQVFTSSAAGDYTVRITETVARTKTIDPKYLPNGAIVNITMSSNETVTSDTPSDKVAELMLSGVNVMCCYDGQYAAFSKIGITSQNKYIPSAHFWVGVTRVDVLGNLLSDGSDKWHIVETTFATAD